MYLFKKRSVWKKIQLLSLSFFVGLLLVATSYPASIFLDFSKEDNTMTLNEDEYLEGEILIKYRKNGFRMMVSELDLTQTGVKGVRKIDFDFEPRVSPLVSLAYVDQYEWYHGKLEDGVSVEDAINNLKDQKNVIVAEPVYIRTTSDIEESVEEVMSNDPLLSQQTYLEEVKIKEAREFLQSKGVNPGGSRDVIVAVIDTGVDYEHEDLKANMWVNSGEIPNNGIDDDNNGIIDDVHGASFIGSSYSYNGDPKDLYGHGTHVAGIIAAQGNNNIGIMGVAPNVRIMAIRAGDASGVFTTYSIAEAINYASKMGADVINMSFGGMMKSKIEEDALQLAYNTSVLVAAAGNNSRVNLPGPGEDFFPAAYPWVIGVMASDGNRTAAFSNYDYKPMDNHEYEVTAPGVNILSTLPNNKYAKWSGTSMAAPIVSGIAALVRSYYTDRTEYTSRFIMGQIVETGPKSVVPPMLSIWDTNYPKVDGYAALTVLPEPNLFVFDYFIFDDKSISPLNDGDGVLDAGETAYIGIIVKNRWGKAIDVNVSLDLTTNGGVANPYIEVTKNNLKYGDIGYFGEVGNGLKYKDGAIVGLTDPFIIKVDPSTPNDIIHTFNVTITCKNGMDLEDDKVYIFDNNTSPSNKFSLATRNGVELPSVIREDMVLTNDKYWIIPNSTKILDGVTVTVEEGTQIQFWSSDPEDVYAQNSIVTLIVKGRFITNGTPEKPVKLFPSGLMPQHSVKIESNQNNNVILNHTEVINPQIQIDYAYNSYFYQNGDYMYSRYLSDGNVYDDYTQPYIYAHEINNSILYNLGYVYLYYTQRLRIEGKLYGNLFNSCFTELNFNSIKDAERNVFLNNYKIDRYDNILPSSIKGIYESTSLTVNEYVKNNKDGTIYISVRAQDYGIASRFAKYLGGYIASINNEEEMNFIRQNHNKLANYDYMVLGYKYQSETNSYMWEDGSPIEYTNWYPNVANKVMGYYKLVADSNGKWQTYNTQWSSSLYYLIEIPSQNLIEDFDFVENEIIIDDQTLDYQVDIILNPVTSSYSDLVFRSTNEEIFKVSSDGRIAGVKPGVATLVVTTNDNYVTKEIIVRVNQKIPVTKIDIFEEIADIAVGEILKLTYKFEPIDTTERQITWTSSDNSVVTVDKFGNIKGIKNGTAIINAYCNDEVFDSVTITVYTPITSINFNRTFYEVLLSSPTTQMIQPNIYPIDATITNLKWYSSNPEVAYVDELGRLIKLKEGNTVIRVTDQKEQFSDEIIVIVNSTQKVNLEVEKVVEYYDDFYALLNDNSIWTWGKNNFQPTKILENVKDVESGLYSIIFLFTDGTVSTNPNGTKVSGIDKVSKITTSESSYAVVDEYGILYAWGNNYYGQIGSGDTVSSSTPSPVGNFTNIKDIKLTSRSLYFILNDGSMYYVGGENKITVPTLQDTVVLAEEFLDSNTNNWYDIVYYRDKSNNIIKITNQTETLLIDTKDAVVSQDKISIINRWSYYDYEAFVYINEDNKIKGYGNNENLRMGTSINDGYQIVGIDSPSKIYLFQSNTFVIDEVGRLYGVGLNTYNNLANFKVNTTAYPVEISFNIQIEDKDLVLEESNVSGYKLVERGFTFVFDFNQAILQSSNFDQIQLIDNLGNLVLVKKEIMLDKLYITLLRDIVSDASTLSLIIPNNAIKTLLGNTNQRISETIEILDPVDVTLINIVEETINLNKGEKYLLNIELSPDNATVRHLIFESSNSNVATVNSYGEVTAVDAGYTIISVKDVNGNCIDTVEVNVKVGLVSLTYPRFFKYVLGEEVYMPLPTINPVNATDVEFIFTSSNPSVAYVDEEGKLIIKKAGLTVIRAASGNIFTEVMVSIIKDEASDLHVIKTEYNHSSSKGYILLSDGTAWKFGHGSTKEKLPLSGIIDVSAGSIGYFLKEDRTVVDEYDTQVGGLTNIVSIKSGYNFLLALDESGKLWALGNNNYGRFGDGTTSSSNEVSVEVGNGLLTNVVNYASDRYTTYVQISNNTIICFGDSNANLEPKAIDFDEEIVNIVQDSSDYNYVYAITKSGKTYRLYGGSESGTYSFNYIDSNKLSISEGSIAVIENGNVRVEGPNNYNRFGNAIVNNYIVGIENAKQVVLTYYNLFVVTTDGELYAAGYNGNYQLCDGTNISRDYFVNNDITLGNKESKLEIVSDDIKKIGEYVTGDKIVIEFNQNIYTSSAYNNIRITNNLGQQLSISRSINNNKLIITLNNNIPLETEYRLYIPSNSIRTFMNQSYEGSSHLIETLYDITIEEIEIEEEVIEIDINETKKLQVTTIPEVSNKYIKYISSDPTIVSIDENGNMYPLKTGTVTITASDNFGLVYDTVEVKVYVKAISINYNQTFFKFKMNENVYMPLPTINPVNATDVEFIFTSSNPSVAYVDEEGKLIIKKAGLTTIKVETGGLFTEVIVSIVNQSTELETRVEKIEYNENNYVGYALMNDKTVYKFGGSLIVPEKLRINNVSDVSVGSNVYFLKSDKTVVDINDNPVPGLTNIKSIKAGRDILLALDEQNTLWAIGDNYYGQLGNGTNVNSYSTPVVVGSGIINNLLDYAPGYYSTYVQVDEKTVIAFGNSNRTTNPTIITFDEKIVKLQKSVYAYDSYAYAITESNKIYTLYNNEYSTYYHQFDHNTVSFRSSSLAYIIDGNVYVTGNNNNGRFGSVTSTYFENKRIEGIENAKQVVISDQNLFIVTTEGDLIASGRNSEYQLGDYTNIDRYQFIKSFLTIGNKEDKLQLISINNMGPKQYLANDEIIVEFNNPINQSIMYNQIRLTNKLNQAIIIDKRIEDNKLIITLGQDLAIGNEYKLNIPANAVKTMMNQGNDAETTIIEPLEKMDIISIDIEEELINLNINESKVINVNIKPNNVSNKYLLFTSSDDNIVSVDRNGVLKPINPGVAVVTVSDIDGEIVDTVIVRVSIFIEEMYVKSRVHFTNLSIMNEQLDIEFKPYNSNYMELSYSSSNPEIAYVDEDGFLQKVSKGIAVIRITDNYSEKFVEVIVNVKEDEFNQPSAKKIQANNNYKYTLMEDGSLWRWNQDIIIPEKLNIDPVKDIDANTSSIIILFEDGTISTSHDGTEKVSGLSDVQKVYTYNGTYYIILSDGVLWGWGNNYRGQLGVGHTENVSQPVQLFEYTNIKDVYAISSTTFVLLDDGRLFMAGHDLHLNYFFTEITEFGKVKKFLKSDSYYIYNAGVINYEDNAYDISYSEPISKNRTYAMYDKLIYTETYSLRANDYNGIAYTDENGYIKIAGENNKYKFGETNTTYIDYKNPITLEGLVNPKQIFIDYDCVYVISDDGFLYGVGNNQNNQFANFTNEFSKTFTKVNFGITIDSEKLEVKYSNINNGNVVDVNKEFRIKFNKNITNGLYYANIRLVNNTTGKTTSIKKNIVLNELIISSINGLDPNSSYSLIIPSSSLKTIFNKSFDGITYSFTTNSNSTNQNIDEIPFRIEYSKEWFNSQRNNFISDGFASVFRYNAILNDFNNTDINTWMKVYADNDYSELGNQEVFFQLNYWGTTNPSIINKMIIDFDDFPQLINILETPYLTSAPDNTFPFVERFELTDIDGNVLENAIIGTNNITLIFNRNMDMNVNPDVFFGPDAPYTDYRIEGAWVDQRTWKGTFVVTAIMGSELQHLFIQGGSAEGNAWLRAFKDIRLGFNVSSSGAESLNLLAYGNEGSITLNWKQDEYDLLAGYNIYRSTSIDGYYEKINTTVIPKDTKEYSDYNVQPGENYYYKFTVVNTDFVESRYSNIVMASAYDTIKPIINHNPVVKATYGMDVYISGIFTDNVGITESYLYYRVKGTDTYTKVNMVSSNNYQYSARILGSNVGITGIEYYIEVTDGVSTVYSGSKNDPHYILVVNAPVVLNVTPSRGHISGGETVTITGDNFVEDMKVYFGSLEASNVVLIDENTLSVVTPMNYPTKADIKIINPAGEVGMLRGAYEYYTDEVSVNIPTINAGIGSSLYIPINLKDFEGLLSASFEIKYDSHALRYVGAERGNIGLSFTMSDNYINYGSYGIVKIAMAGSTGIKGSGNIVYLKFEFNEDNIEFNHEYSLEIQSVKLNDGSITTNVTHGKIYVTESYQVLSYIYYYSNSTPVPGARVEILGDANYLVETDLQGMYVFTGLSEGNYQLEFEKEDSNISNGDITAYDAALILQYEVGLKSLSNYQLIAADVNNNGEVNAMDASLILQYAAGLISLPFSGNDKVWYFVQENIDLGSVNTNRYPQNNIAILIGDVSGNWGNNGIQSMDYLGLINIGQLIIDKENKLVSIPVTINYKHELYSIDTIISYSDVLELVSIDKDNNLYSVINTNEKGKIRIATASAKNIDNDNTTYLITFRYDELLGEKYYFDIDFIMFNEKRNVFTSGNAFNLDLLNGQAVNIDRIVGKSNSTYNDEDISDLDYNFDGIIDIFDIVKGRAK